MVLHHSLPVFIQSLQFFLHSVRIPKRFYSMSYSTIGNFDRDPAIKLVSTSFYSFSIIFHPVLLTKIVISTFDAPNSDEWLRRYGIQQSIHCDKSWNRTHCGSPLFFVSLLFVVDSTVYCDLLYTRHSYYSPISESRQPL
jgi:hypothetical protein